MFLQRVLELISNEGITRNKFLVELNLSKNSFVAWENRGTIPGGDTLAKIADYFDVSVDYLLGRTDEKVQPEQGGSPLRSTLLCNFEQLNQEGQEQLVDTSDTMVTSGKYKKCPPLVLDAAEE